MQAAELFEGRAVWHVNSTARGGGVVELLTSLLAYARGAGVDARWTVIGGNAEFFAITKRIHNRLHGYAGDGGELGIGRALRLRPGARGQRGGAQRARCERDDIVFLHDPQTAGLVRAAEGDRRARRLALPRRRRPARTSWRATAWDFLRPYVERADAYVFSRQEFAWEGLDRRPDLDRPALDRRLLAQEPGAGRRRPSTAILAGRRPRPADGPERAPTFVREDGTPGRVDRRGRDRSGRAACPATRRWSARSRAGIGSRIPSGVLRGLRASISSDGRSHLLLAGPSVAAVADDPEGAEVLAESRAARAALPRGAARRVHLACLPMDDVEENAAIVNAIQRRADIVVQKSLAEGFGLTVAEAMWKAAPGRRHGRRRHPGPDRGRRERDPDRQPVRSGRLRGGAAPAPGRAGSRSTNRARGAGASQEGVPGYASADPVSRLLEAHAELTPGAQSALGDPYGSSAIGSRCHSMGSATSTSTA